MKKSILLGMLVVGASMCGCSSSGDSNSIAYLAVQFDKGGDWSIIDANGNVVVKEEYNSDDKISAINENGVYWVKNEDGYQLYNIKTPKNPITDTYQRATSFNCGRAAVSNPGEQMCLIDETGKIIKELPEEITRVYAFSDDGLAVYQCVSNEEDESYGYIDSNGNVKIKAKYSDVSPFYEGLALVITDEDKEKDQFHIIDIKGDILGTIKGNKYDLGNTVVFSEGLLPVYNKGKEKVEYLDKKGEVVFTLEKGIRSADDFIDGYALINNKDNQYGVINKKGEVLIRPKYRDMDNLGNGLFIAEKKDGRVGIVDKNDNPVIDFDYTKISPFKLGNNYLVWDGEAGMLINQAGKKQLKEDLCEVSMGLMSSYAEYINVKAIASKIVDAFNQDNFNNMKYAVATAADVAKKLELSDASNYRYNYDYRYNYNYLNGSFKLPYDNFVSASQRFLFSEDPVKTLSHQEKENYYYYVYERTVIDGYEFSNSVKLDGVKLEVQTYDSERLPIDLLFNQVCAAITDKGFTEKSTKEKDKNCFVSQNGDVSIVISYDGSYLNIVAGKTNSRTITTAVRDIALEAIEVADSVAVD